MPLALGQDLEYKGQDLEYKHLVRRLCLHLVNMLEKEFLIVGVPTEQLALTNLDELLIA